MAKVGTELIEHKTSGKYVEVVIKLYTKTKMFHAEGFPEDLTKYWGSKRDREDVNVKRHHSGAVYAESYDKCVQLAKQVYKEYCEQDIKEIKIIAYRVKSNADNKNQLSFAPSLALGIEYKILNRIIIGDESFVSTGSYEDSKLPDDGHRSGGHRLQSEAYTCGYSEWEKVLYTDEAHEFFKKTTDGLRNMIFKVNNFFGDSAEVLLDNISNGKLISND